MDLTANQGSSPNDPSVLSTASFSNFGVLGVQVASSSSSSSSNVNLGLILGVSIPLGILCTNYVI
jgi:hypothetical protein